MRKTAVQILFEPRQVYRDLATLLNPRLHLQLERSDIELCELHR